MPVAWTDAITGEVQSALNDAIAKPFSIPFGINLCSITNGVVTRP